MRVARALTVAGSDSGGGAGIQADLKTFAALGVYGSSAVTALTAQNTTGVRGVLAVSPEFVAAQIDAVMDDIGAGAWKTGMLTNAAIVEVVAERARRHGVGKLVVDPVMMAKGGDPLLEPEAREALVRTLMPLALVVTPNRHEAEILTGLKVDGWDAMKEAARAIHGLGARHVVIKGGHVDLAFDGTAGTGSGGTGGAGADRPGDGRQVVDLLYDGRNFTAFRAPRIETANTHGTGCTFAAAIAAGLAAGRSVAEAVGAAREYLTAALRSGASLQMGAGHGPVDHFAGRVALSPAPECSAGDA